MILYIQDKKKEGIQMTLFTVFYKNNRLNKIYRSRVRASSMEKGIEVLKQAVGYDIDIIDIEAMADTKKYI